jgi:protein transport protein SEC24
MAAPQDGFQGQGYPAQDQYGQQSPAQPGFGAGATSPPPPGQPEHEGGKKKKRGYAAQAYDFGAGANSALGGQVQGGGAFTPAQTPAYGGYPQQPEQQPAYGGSAPQYGAPIGAPVQGIPPVGYGSGAPQYGSGVGYQAPDAGYPAPGAPTQGGVAGITQGMGQMGVGGAQPVQQSQQAAVRPAVLNQLYPTDLLNQPFNVAELELPPPPIILPPNVSLQSRQVVISANCDCSRASPPQQTQTVLRNTSVRLLMRFLPHTLCSRSQNSPLPLSSSHILLYTMWMTLFRLCRIK